MLDLFLNDPIDRPNRLEDKKDLGYHARYARYCLYSSNLENYRTFLVKSATNRAFYKGLQWIFDEDLDAFLMDESGEVRNRIKFVQNIVKPYVEYYRGSAIRMDISATAMSISRFSVSRKIMELEKMRHLTKVAQMSASFGEAIKTKFNIGDTIAETENITQNLYKDRYEERVNALIRAVSKENEFEDIKVRVAHNLAMDGLGVVFEEERNGEQVFELIDNHSFIFDSTAKRPDLKDAQFMGDFWMASPTQLYERYTSLSQIERAIIEESSKQNTNGYGSFHQIRNDTLGQRVNGRLPVYRLFWDDTEKVEYGVVQDGAGYTILTKINSSDSVYTDKDLIEPPDGFYEETLLNKGRKVKNKKITVYEDTVRYCEFTPSEFLNGATKDDIIYKYGIRPHQYKSSFKKKYTDKPYKCSCWALVDGDILSPIDDVIDPQRMINRMNSMAESQINNSRGAGVIYDKDMVDEQEGEEGMQRNMNQSKPVGLNAQGRLNNSIMSYDSTVKQGTFGIYNVADRMKAIADNLFGGGEALLGQGGGYRVSVGAIKQNLTQATTTQEPFFYALSNIMMQCMDSISNRGRIIYSLNPSRMANLIGDEGILDFNATKEMVLEDFKIHIYRSTNRQEEIEMANEFLTTLLTNQLIDKEVYAKYFGNADMKEVGMAIREYTAKMLEAERQQAKIEEARAKITSDISQIAMASDNNERDFQNSQSQIENEKTRINNLEAKAVANLTKVPSKI